MKTILTRVDYPILEHFIDKNYFKLLDSERMLLRRYCAIYCKVYDMPIGRPIAKFMMIWNQRHPNHSQFSNEQINFYYTY